MLARAAENLYWMARYLERAENTARLINSTTHVLLDLPPGASFGWANLVEVAGLDELFETKYPAATEEATMRFLIEDANNPSSICSCVQYARENTRGLREVLPAEMWERINTLYHFVREHAPGACRSRRERYLVLDAIIEKRHAIIGMVAGTMARDTAFHIIRLGRNIERADMTTRILDLNSAVQFPQDSVLHETLMARVWKSTLDSLSAYQSYRRLVNMHVRSDAVIGFLLRDMRFPRSVEHCLSEMESAYSQLPRSQQLLQLTARLRHKVAQRVTDHFDAVALHEYLDLLQKELGEINDALAANYFHAFQADLKQLGKGQTEIVFADQ
jgi:uncharacterized alpha-E superfamily protein